NILADTFATPSSVGGMVVGLPSTSMDGRLIGFVYVRLMSTSVSGTFPAGLPHGVDSLAPDAAPSAPEVGAGAPAAPPAATRLAATGAPATPRAAEVCAIPRRPPRPFRAVSSSTIGSPVLRLCRSRTVRSTSANQRAANVNAHTDRPSTECGEGCRWC